MKKILFVLFLFSCTYSFSSAKDAFYPVSEIPSGLLKNANSIVRNKEIFLDIKSKTKITYTIKEVVTVLNSNGDRAGILYLPYDSNIKPTITKACFYDSGGNEIKKVKKSEIYDQCYFDGFSLFNDARFKRITPHLNVYPYTVEYEYSFEYDGVIDYRNWLPCDAYNKSVQYSNFNIQIFDNSKIRIKENRIGEAINTVDSEGGISYFWEIKNMNAIEYEPYSVELFNLVPFVQISPVEFSYYGKEGNMSTWTEFGDWINNLLLEKDNLPLDRINQLKQLTAGNLTEFEKVKLVYEFLQEKTRYVSVQLGIGGFQPFSAKTVDEVGYGDCKALVNYMRAMLSGIGIKSYYTLVNAGSSAEEIDPLFPAQEFNHVILTVPMENDTVFLECTNQFSPCGFLGDFTSDRYALMVSENGSSLVRTKRYDESDNTWHSRAKIVLNNTGTANIVDTVDLQGEQYDIVESELRKTKEKQIETALKNNKIPGAKFVDISYIAEKNVLPKATRTRKFEVIKYATLMSDRMFFPLNVLNKRTSVPRKDKNRKNDFELGMPYSDTDRITYSLPEGYGIEYIPESKELKSEFGSYSYKINVKNNRLFYERRDIRLTGQFPSEKYMDYVNYSKEIVNLDNQKIILKKL